MVHHFAGPESPAVAAGQAAYLKATHGDVPAPTANLYLDVTGKVWVLSARADSSQSELGRANHAGAGIWPASGAVLPRDEANSYSVGIEVQNDGTHPLSGFVFDRVVALCADLCRRYDLPASRVLGHKEYAHAGSNIKIDPLNDCDDIRNAVDDELAKGAAMSISDSDAKKIGAAVWAAMLQSGWQDDGAFDPANPVHHTAAWFLASARGAALEAANGVHTAQGAQRAAVDTAGDGTPV